MTAEQSSSKGDSSKTRDETRDGGPVRSCAGITYFTTAMKKKRVAPYCFGRRGTVALDEESTVPRQVVEKAAATGDRQSRKGGETAKGDKPNVVDLTYLCMGYSQMTPKMQRQGALPLCDVGFRFTLVRANQAAQAADAKAADPQRGLRAEKQRQHPNTLQHDLPPSKMGDGDSAVPSRGDIARAPTAAAATPAAGSPTLVLGSATALDTLEAGGRALVRGATYAGTASMSFWKKALTNYPEKYRNFSMKMAKSMSKQLSYSGKILTRITKSALGWLSD